MITSNAYDIPVTGETIHLPFRAACARTDNKRLRKITYDELATGANVPESNIGNFMAGRQKRPDVEYIGRVARYINEQFERPVLSLDELLQTGYIHSSGSVKTPEEGGNRLMIQRAHERLERLETVTKRLRIALIAVCIVSLVIGCIVAIDIAHADWGKFMLRH